MTPVIPQKVQLFQLLCCAVDTLRKPREARLALCSHANRDSQIEEVHLAPKYMAVTQGTKSHH